MADLRVMGDDSLPASRGILKEPRKKKKGERRKVATRARMRRIKTKMTTIASLPHPENGRLKNCQNHMPRPKS